MKINIFLSAIICLSFLACQEKPTTVEKPKQINDADYIPNTLYALIHISLESLKENSIQQDFLSYRLRKNDSIRALDALGVNLKDFNSFYLGLGQQPFQLFTFKNKVELELLYQSFIKNKKKYFHGERLAFKNKVIYCISRKDDSIFLHQISDKKMMAGSQEDILNCLNSAQNNFLTQNIDKNLPLSLIIHQSPELPQQFKFFKRIRGKLETKDEINSIDLKAEFKTQEEREKNTTLIKTLLNFATLPNELKTSLQYKEEDTALSISSQISDTELKNYLTKEKSK